MLKLTLPEARRIILHAAGLSKRGQFGRGKEAVYKFIDHLGHVQLDTNYVVERAHHHAIAARVPDYELQWLHQLQDEGRIFEYWTFASGFMPMKEFRFSLPVKEAMQARWKPPTPAEAAMMRRVMDRISREGPLMARDFEQDRTTKNKGWWDWRPSKVALERLYFSGKLTALRRLDFQKVYDLTTNVIPAGIDTSLPTKEEFAHHVIRRGLQSMGLATVRDLHRLSRYVKHNKVKEEVKRLIAEEKIETVEVEGLKGQQFCIHPAYKGKKVALSGEAFVLSPFDYLNVFRDRLKDFFNFDYMVECFVPEPKRKYGYFALPILVGDTFVARMDSKVDRKNGVLTINNLHFERVRLTKSLLTEVAEAIRSFAGLNKCAEIVVNKTNDKVAARAVTA